MDTHGLASRVIEGLDSLWFFSSVLSSTTARQVLLEPPTEEFSKPILENPSAVVAVDVVGPETSLAEREETMARGRGNGKRRRRRKSRKIFGETDLGLDNADAAKETKVSDSHEFTAAWWFEGNCGYCQKQQGRLYHHYKNMPPLHDDIAMKQHLNSGPMLLLAQSDNLRILLMVSLTGFNPRFWPIISTLN